MAKKHLQHRHYLVPQGYQSHPQPPVPSRPPVRRRVMVIEEVPQLPAFMKRLHLLCRHHPIPLPMTFLGEDLTPEGDALAVYGCGHRHCGYREGWTLNPHNNQPCKALSGHAG